MNLIEATKNLISVFQDKNSPGDELNKAIEVFRKKSRWAKSLEVENAMLLIAGLFTLEDVERASLASLICGNLCEKGYSATAVIPVFINHYRQLLNTAGPSLKFIKEGLDTIKQEDEDADTDDVMESLKQERARLFPVEIGAVNALEKFYLCGIAVLSSMPEAVKQAKTALADVFEYAEISEGCFWLSKLFSVLFNEPVLVINMLNKKGIVGEMSGVTDNVQLQLLLMGMKEINEKATLARKYLNIVNGKGKQDSGKSITGQWNLNNWDYIWELARNRISDVHNFIGNWIWGEGTPVDISLYDGYRVIILTPPSYKRVLGICRTFNNLKADITVKKVLTKQEIEQWLQKFES